MSFCSLDKFRPLAITVSDCHLDIALVSLESFRACIAAVNSSSCVEADLVSSASVVLDSVLILITLRCRAPEAAKAAENVQLKKKSQSLLSIGKKRWMGSTTYNDANSEDSGEFACVGRVAVVEKNFFLDPFIVHGVEDGHANPEPYVQGSEHATKISALLQAGHARG